MADTRSPSARILLADESAQARSALVNVLRREGYDLLEVADGDQAFQHLQQGEVTVALLEADLPGMSGLEILHESVQQRLPAPIILGTSSWNLKRAVNAMKEGAFDYLTKPYNPQEVLDALHSALDMGPAKPAPLNEEQLRQAQKMEAVGRLASGVVHDFNNLLTVILGYSDILRGNLDHESALRPFAEEISKAAEQGAALTQQLLAFSRQQVLEPQVLNLNAAVGRMESLLRRLTGQHVELVTDLDSELYCIRADASQIDQILMNLAVNARDAMPRGGRLLLKTVNLQLFQPLLEQHIPAGAYVLLTVEDNGCGMDSRTQARIFEPFFTTKTQGQGTGLGLTTVHRIVQESDGYITVASQPGRGATFTIFWPQAHEPASDPSLTVRPPSHHGTETVLLVEDDGSVRTLVRLVLEMNGYSVSEANSTDEAIRRCADAQHPVHLLITDLIMPHTLGQDLAKRLTKLCPQLQVLFITGYSNNALVEQSLHQSHATLLRKPFTADTLLNKVRAALEGRLVTQ